MSREESEVKKKHKKKTRPQFKIFNINKCFVNYFIDKNKKMVVLSVLKVFNLTNNEILIFGDN